MPNFVAEIHLTQKIRWLIHENDPTIHDLSSFPGWSIINPLVYDGLILRYKLAHKTEPFDPRKQITQTIGLFKEQVLIETETVMLLSSLIQESPQIQPEKLNDYLELFIMHLRQASKQAELTGIGITTLQIMELDNQHLGPSFPEPSKVLTVYCRKYRYETAIKWKQIQMADESLASNELLVYNTLLLDAIQAFLQLDFRGTILYAAIAIESLAATKLAEIYDSYLVHGDPGGIIRIIPNQTRGGKEVKRDPIYEDVLSKPNWDSLIHLIHERPLYLLRRSVYIEDRRLYELAFKLKKTRDKIVHIGELPTRNQSEFLSLDKHGAKTALKCALDLFKWFGITEEYFIPGDAFVQLVDERGGEEILRSAAQHFRETREHRANSKRR